MIVDGVLRDWGERTSYGTVKGRKGRNIFGGRYSKSAKEPKLPGRQKLSATTKRAPEVMVKITGSGKDMRGIKGHLDYISRHGKLEVEDERGLVYHGKEDVLELRDSWKGTGIPSEKGVRREVFNVMVSMPPGTDREAVKKAARNFASEVFENHQYVFVAHNDEKHPHVHIAVKAVDLDGIRMNPRKADLQQWREVFASELREQGIEANATPRMARGVIKKAERQVVRHINKEHAQGKRKAPAKVTVAQREEAEWEAAGTKKHSNPAQSKIVERRKQIQRDYGDVARALAKSASTEDKRLALSIVDFVKQMPPVTTQHQQRVTELKKQMEKQGRTVYLYEDKSR